MALIGGSFPSHTQSNDLLAAPFLQSPGLRLEVDGVEEIFPGSLSYMQFIALVKKLWEQSHPQIPILPIGMNRESFMAYKDLGSTSSIGEISSSPSSSKRGVDNIEEFPAVIGYSLELRKAATIEPKPRMRQHVLNNSVTIYGQKFQNVVAFTVMSKSGLFEGLDGTTTKDDLDTAVLCDQIIEAFEDFMIEYTPILKAAGASELVYSRRLSDSEVNKENKQIHKRTVTYMLTTEKTFAIRNERIEKIKIDIRTWLSNLNPEQPVVEPDSQDIEISIVDQFSTTTE